MIGLLAAAAVLATPAADRDPQAQLADLEHLYQQSCGDRAYGSFNDVCRDMRDRIRTYRRQLLREARSRPAAPTPAVAPAPGGSSPTGLAPSPP